MKTIYIATRGSALALAQANFIQGECRRLFPRQVFEIRIIKTTGDKLQKASLAHAGEKLPRGLFTKELEEALLNDAADLAVHSLKDLPTNLPSGLKLGATPKREDVRDVLIFRENDLEKNKTNCAKIDLNTLRVGAVVGTSSTRRAAQLLELRPDLKIIPLRGNVGTRLHKLAQQKELDAIVLAAAGLARLQFSISDDGKLSGEKIPTGLRVTFLQPEEVLPCVGQAAIGIEIREGDQQSQAICEKMNHLPTWHCIIAERAFLRAMGGGCQSPIGAYAQVCGKTLRLRAVSFLGQKVQRTELEESLAAATELGQEVANRLQNESTAHLCC